jgi:hypothetical protein
VEEEEQCVRMTIECGQQGISNHGACEFELINTAVV